MEYLEEVPVSLLSGVSPKFILHNQNLLYMIMPYYDYAYNCSWLLRSLNRTWNKIFANHKQAILLNCKRQTLKIRNCNSKNIHDLLSSEDRFEYFNLDCSECLFIIDNKKDLKEFMKIIEMNPTIKFTNF